MLHLNVAKSTAAITLSSCTSESELSPTNDKNAEPNMQFPFGMALI